jgi:hypothetical protein
MADILGTPIQFDRFPGAWSVVSMWAHLMAAGFGIWLMAAPAILGYDGIAADHDHVLGPVIASTAICAAWQITRALRWINIVLGAWLILAPFVLSYETTPLENSSVVGLAVLVLSMVRGKVTHAFGGGWRSLLARPKG